LPDNKVCSLFASRQQRFSLFKTETAQLGLKLIERVPLIEKPERLVDLLLETEELVKIFITSIKTAEKKQK
jgi:hypothetical protein